MQNYDDKKVEYFFPRSDSQVLTETYFLDGYRHRTDGPARIRYFRNGNIDSIRYCLNGKSYRADGPTSIGFNRNGSVSYEYYYRNEDLHRVGGYATIEYFHYGGEINKRQFYLNGIRYWEIDYFNTLEEALSVPLAMVLLDTREWVREWAREYSLHNQAVRDEVLRLIKERKCWHPKYLLSLSEG